MRNLWNIISALAAVLAVGVALFVFFQGRLEQRKQLTVELLSRSSLVNEALDPSERGIEVRLNERVIPNYASFQLRVVNSGGQPIRSEDFEAPLEFEFPGAAEILSADQTGGDPVALRVTPRIQSTKVVVEPTLLNPTDWYGLEIGVVPATRKVPQVLPSGRIAGLKRIAFNDLVAEPRAAQGDGSHFRLLLYVQAALMLLVSLQAIFVTIRRLRSAKEDG